MNSLQLFLNQVQSAHESLKLTILQIVFDIIMVYEGDLLYHSEDVVRRSIQ